MILTTYFSMIRYLPDGVEAVSIARKTPTNIRTCSRFFPSADLLRKIKSGMISEEEYAKVYNAMLAELDPADAYKALDGKALVCYEKPPAFCHRHLVSAWFRKNGFDCKEYVREDAQQSLF